MIASITEAVVGCNNRTGFTALLRPVVLAYCRHHQACPVRCGNALPSPADAAVRANAVADIAMMAVSLPMRLSRSAAAAAPGPTPRSAPVAMRESAPRLARGSVSNQSVADVVAEAHGTALDAPRVGSALASDVIGPQMQSFVVVREPVFVERK